MKNQVSQRPERVALCLLALIVLAFGTAAASSHREAPAIAGMPRVDSTDLYMFNSYESGRTGMVTLIANYYPFQDPWAGPNYFALDPDAFYRIHIDNTGDGVEDITFQFRVASTLRGLTVPVGGQQIPVPLINIGPITGGVGAGRSPNLNRLESYTLTVWRGPVQSGGGRGTFVTGDTGSNRFVKPVDNIGQKSIPNYNAYATQHIHNFNVAGCGNAQGRVFVGQRKEPFAVNVGEIFDLVNLDPLGARDAEPNPLAEKNITTFAIEVPATCLTNGSNPVIGGWQTAAIRRTRILRDNPSFEDPADQGGDFVQVSRLGMPLVNEIVIGLPDKNRFNASQPQDDGQFARYVTNPTLPELIQILFPVQAPNNFPRRDLVAAFLTGVPGLNQLGGPAEMMRLNTSTPPVPSASQNNLGALGGDLAGFPNGRRPGDDVVDIELRVAMGALCHAFPGVFCNPADAPSGTLPYTDQVLQDASQFDSVFPYLRAPLPGSPNGPNGVGRPEDDSAP